MYKYGNMHNLVKQEKLVHNYIVKINYCVILVIGGGEYKWKKNN